jgi:hypothetical protein
VELALIAPIMVLLVLGVLDLARAYQLSIRLENAAREGAAFAQVYPNDATCGPSGSIRGQVEAEEPGLSATPGFDVDIFGQNAADEWVELSGCSGTVAGPGERVKVEVRATYGILTPIVANVVGNSIVLEGAAEVRVQGQVRS